MQNQKTYFISEVQHVNSFGKAEEFLGGSLKAAKIAASKRQYFQLTVMKIEDCQGNLLAYKNEKGAWVDCNNYF